MQSYEGYFENSKFNGKGKLTFDTSDELQRKHYRGQFIDNRMEGPGTLTFQNGDVIVANWKDSKIQGQGLYIWSDGVRQRITMNKQDDEMIFEKRLIFPEDDFRIEYRGELKDKRVLHGVGSLTVADEKTYKSFWHEGHS